MHTLGGQIAVSTEKVKEVRADAPTLKAARVRVGLDQTQLARAAGVARPTVSALENSSKETHEGTRRAIQQALESRGIVFTNGDRPGFCFDKDKVIVPS